VTPSSFQVGDFLDQSQKLPVVFLRHARVLARCEAFDVQLIDDAIVALMLGSRKLFSSRLLYPEQDTQRRMSGVCARLRRGGARELGRKETDDLRLVVASKCNSPDPTWFDSPNLFSVFGNGAVAGELARSGNVQDDLASPCLGVRV